MHDLTFIPVRFTPGHIYLTTGIMQFITKDGQPVTERTHFLARCLARHLRGDWGDLDAHDYAVNRAALRSGGQLLSSYIYDPDHLAITLWVISDSIERERTLERATTTVLLPQEY